MRSLFPLVALIIAAAPAQGQEGPVGNWQGFWYRAGDSLPVTVAVQVGANPGQYTAQFSSERLRISGIPFAEFGVVGCCTIRMMVRGDRSALEFSGELRGDSLSGTFQEGTAAGRFAYARTPTAPPAFDERPVTFSNGGVTLAGSVLLPKTGGSLAAVVFLHGSGAEGRWASRFLAEQFARRGIAALIFDKRGVGESSGDWRTATTEDLAADGAAAIARLRQEPRVDSTRTGIFGHSQGGTLAPFVAAHAGARAATVAFIIASAAAGTPTDSTEIFSVLNAVLPNAASAADSATANDYVSELVAVAYHGRPRARLDSLAVALRDRPWFFAPPAADNGYWAFSPVFARYRPLEWWSQVRVPVLLVYGADDRRVPAAESAPRIAAALRNGGNADVTVQIHQGADHTLRLAPGPSGWPVTAPGYLPGILEWLARR